MKKSLSLLLIFCCFFLLTACGEKNSTQLSVELKPMEEASVPGLLLPYSATDNVESEVWNLSAPISCSIDFTPEQTRNMSNFSNGGFYCADDMLYGQMRPGSGEFLRLSAVEINADGKYVHFGTPFFLEDDISSSYICLSGEMLYYVRECNSSGEVSIAGANKSGGDPEILYRGEDCNYLQLHRGRLYFTDEDNRFVSADMNGTDMQIIIEKEVYFPYFIDEEWILYQDSADNESFHLFSSISQYDIKLNDMRSFTPVIAGSALYYLGIPAGESHRHLCRIDLSNLSFDAVNGITEYTPDIVAEIGEPDVYTLFSDGEYIYGANNKAAPLADWKSFTDEGYLHLTENCFHIQDRWSIGYQFNDSGEVKNVLLHQLTDASVSVLPEVYG